MQYALHITHQAGYFHYIIEYVKRYSIARTRLFKQSRKLLISSLRLNLNSLSFGRAHISAGGMLEVTPDCGHSHGDQQTVAHAWNVENTLGQYKAHIEEQVGGWQEWKDQNE